MRKEKIKNLKDIRAFLLEKNKETIEKPKILKLNRIMNKRWHKWLMKLKI